MLYHFCRLTCVLALVTAAALELRSDTELKLIPGERRQFRATISVPSIPPPVNPGATPSAIIYGCTVLPTLEIYDTTSGRTQVVLTQTSIVPSIGL
jgi:hypothetical protein